MSMIKAFLYLLLAVNLILVLINPEHFYRKETIVNYAKK